MSEIARTNPKKFIENNKEEIFTVCYADYFYLLK